MRDELESVPIKERKHLHASHEVHEELKTVNPESNPKNYVRSVVRAHVHTCYRLVADKTII